MSKSNTLFNYHCLISLYQYEWNWSHLLWLEIEKGDLINQSSLSFILFIISVLDFTVLISPLNAPHPRVIDWSWGKSHSSFFQPFILSSTILRHSVNASWPIIRELRKERLERLNDLFVFPTYAWITRHLTERDISWLTVETHIADGLRDIKCSVGVTWLFNVTTYSRESASQSLSINQSYLNRSISSHYGMLLTRSEFYL